MSGPGGAFCSWPKVFLFGASITEYSFSKDGCWGTLLADYLQRKCDVIVRGFAGYTTRNGKQVLPHLLDAKLAKDVVAMTVLLGSNDANDKGRNPWEHVSLQEYENNLKEIVSYAVSQGISSDKIILITPPAFHIDQWAEFHGYLGNNTITFDFSEYLSDGLHLSSKGSHLLFELLKPIITQLTSHLPVVWFPFHDRVDIDNLEKSLLNSEN
uniref:SGNH hydrolase-type esterase domain-containing protein n=1 Tax=Biomphalaria glabrata TaxID=6526 RepID=A0A2C9KZI4_BIOGL